VNGKKPAADPVEKRKLACIFSFLSMNNNSIPMQKIRKRKKGHYIEEGPVRMSKPGITKGKNAQTSTMPCP